MLFIINNDYFLMDGIDKTGSGNAGRGGAR